MKVVATICEYNPFHNGHLYQLKKIREVSKCDCLVVILSTYFTMRGDLSIHNPFLKTKYALEHADLVVALPSVLAVNSADYFALNAVKEINKLNIKELYIGSELDSPNIFENIYKEYKINNIKISKLHKNGLSYKTNLNIDLKPNDLLGFCYYKAIKDNNFDIKINTIKRISSNHGELVPNNNLYCSSSAIRNNYNLINNYCPSFVSNNIYDYDKLFNIFKYNTIIINKYSNILNLSEGIDKYIINNIIKSNNFNELLYNCKNKRYSISRIKRAIFHMLINDVANEDYKYSRILGFNEKGKNYLNLIKKDAHILTNIKYGISKILDIELNLSKIIDLVYNDSNYKLEISKPIIR